MITHDEADCPHCRECPGCEGSPLPEDIANPVVIRLSGGYAGIRCGDCNGEGVACACGCHL